MKRVLSIQDISCLGKCSLTVALPVISAAGIETAIMPTAMLSVHTWFKSFTFHDLTDEIMPVCKNWKEHNFEFDGISTGYLGSFRQIELVEEAFAMFNKPGMLKLVDPVLGDNGKFYVGFDSAFAKRMAHLCGKADVIVPNLTEVAAMLGEEYCGSGYDEKYIRERLKRLAGLGCPNVVITGVSYEKGRYGVAAWNAEKEEYSTYFGEEQPGTFHGTGDLFSAALFAALIREQNMAQALETAVEFTVESIRMTLQNPDHVPYGVEFERAIPCLLGKLNLI
ncbi:MAG: pyridoxamine kinase [Lentisphaeria bacterium]|nr:pyridoxamine kinase [Lentisphaeria bacterium]